MKSKFVELGEDDRKARSQILGSLSACDFHILSRKLLHRFENAKGPMFAIFGEWLDLEELIDYDRGELGPTGEYSIGERPTERLVAFVRDYLRTTRNGIVLSENWGADRVDIAKMLWPPPRVACYRDNEVYHILTPEITDLDSIEAAVSGSHHWQTNVCSSCARVPEGDIPSEAFLDEIVENTKHIFIPAFDGDGYLVWSPRVFPRPKRVG